MEDDRVVRAHVIADPAAGALLFVMLARTGSIMTVPWLINQDTRAAAAAPWATQLGMSLGPWQAPAMKIPSVMVATGSSLWMPFSEEAVEVAAHAEHQGYF